MQEKERLEKSVELDQQAREAIVNKLDNNFFVEASAGSGKTTSLVYRMVSLIERKEDVSVDKICTITFTKAAADEFFNRFQKLLSIRSVPTPDEDSDKVLGPKTEESMKRCQEALNNIDLCFLGTIDSFCNMIAHELPNEFGIPSDSMVISKEENSQIIKEEYNNILKDSSHPLHLLAMKIKDLFYEDYEVFFKCLTTVSESRNADIIFDRALVNVDFEQYFKNEKPELIRLIDILCSSSVNYKNDKDGNRNQKYKYQISLKIRSRRIKTLNWNDCVSDIEGAIRDIKKMAGFAASSKDTDLGNYLEDKEKITASSSFKYSEDTNRLINEVETKISEYKYSLVMSFALLAMDDINKKLKLEGKFQFFDFLYYLTNAFKESASKDRVVVDHILSRHSYFLLDESQDTNPLQTEMFFYLTGTKTAKDVKDWDWTKTEPREGSLFIVGDPKQSIYSFRNANVQAYIKTREIFEKKGEVLVLTRNFRSNYALKSWFNGAMNQILNHGDDALEHIDIPISTDEVTANITNPIVIDGVYKYNVLPKDEPIVIAKFIKHHVNNPRYLITDKKGNERTIRYSDFLIVPRNTNVHEFIYYFNVYHIPMTIEAKIPFGDSETLLVIKDLLYLLKEPLNKSYFLKVVQGNLFKLNDTDVIQMMNDGFKLDITNLNYKSGQPIAFSDQKHMCILLRLNNLYQQTKGLSYSSTLLYLLNNLELNIFKCIDSSNLEYAYFLIEKIKEKEESGEISSLTDLSKFIESFIVMETDDNRSLRFKDKVDRVKISNLHKVKGLQAPIVILAKPKENIKNADRFVDCNYNPPKAYFSKITGGEHNQALIETKMFEDQLPRWNAFAQAEKDRLEYVAATRAESLLLVSSATKLDSDETSPWVDLVNHITDEYAMPTDVDPDTITPVEAKLSDIHYNEDLYNPTYHHLLPSDIRYDNDATNKDEISEYEVKEDATLIGTIIHKLMECLVSSHNSYNNIHQLVYRIASDYGATKYIYLLEKTARTLLSKGGFDQKNSSMDKDILNTLLSAKRVWCEVPFSYKDEGDNIINGVIDCMYLDDKDQYHIIDYKTNKEDDVSMLEKEYQSQLDHYKKAAKTFGVNADAHIYHIDV